MCIFPQVNYFKILVFFIAISLPSKFMAQVDFVLTNTICAGDTVSLVANTGTFNASSYSWTATPSGPSFANSNANHTDLYFPASGIYTVYLTVSNGTTVATASHVVTVYALPTIWITSTDTLLCAGNDATLTAFGGSTFFWEPQNQVSAIAINKVYINPFVTTTFTVTGVDNIGCKNAAYFTQLVVNYPNVIVNASSDSVCAGTNATLQATGAASYTWTGTSLSSVVQSTVAAGPGNYTVVGSNGGACKDTATYSILLSSPPIVTLLMERGFRCIKDTVSEPGILLTVSGASTYTWKPYVAGEMTYSIGPSTFVTPTVTTCYTVFGSSGSCTGSVTACVQVSECLSLDAIYADNNHIELFPNPARDHFYVRFPAGKIAVEVRDLSGRLLIEKGHLSTEAEILNVDIGELLPGLYFVVVQQASGVTTRRILKE